MGDLQTYFYLALISVVMIGLTLTFVGIAGAGLRRWFRQAHGQAPLTFWLVGSAIARPLVHRFRHGRRALRVHSLWRIVIRGG